MKTNVYILSFVLIIFSCKKEDLVFSGDLNFSNDTVMFDTVFASIGSITKTLTVYNNKDYNIITNIQLLGSSAANFRINVDGISENIHKNIDKIIFKVIDEGKGFKETDTKKIFNRFYSNRPDTFGEHSGLGLNIVKNLVELHSATINASNNVTQEGANVEIVFPKV